MAFLFCFCFSPSLLDLTTNKTVCFVWRAMKLQSTQRGRERLGCARLLFDFFCFFWLSLHLYISIGWYVNRNRTPSASGLSQEIPTKPVSERRPISPRSHLLLLVVERVGKTVNVLQDIAGCLCGVTPTSPF